MKIEEALDILENIIDDEVIGTYCVEIQKEGVNCSKNCEDKDCYLSEAIRTIVNYIDKLQQELKDSINARFELQRRIDKTQKENAELKEEIKDLIKENHKHIDYIANMKKKHEDKIRAEIKELEEILERRKTIDIVEEINRLDELLEGE